MALFAPEGDGQGDGSKGTFDFARRTRTALGLTPSDVPQRDDALLKLQASAAQKAQSEKAARVLKLQFKTGLDADLIDRNLDEVEADAAKADFNAEEYRRNNPKLAKWLSESPHHISLSKPDMVPLRDLDRLFRRVDDPTRPLLKSEMETMARTLAKSRAAQHEAQMATARERAGRAGDLYTPPPSAAPQGPRQAGPSPEDIFYNEALAEIAAENEYVSGVGPVSIGETLKRKTPQSFIPFVASLDDTANKIALLKSAQAVEAGTATDEQAILVARFGRVAAAEQRRGRDLFAKVADIAAALPATIGEFALTAGAYRGGKAAAENLLKGSIRKALSGHAARSGVRNAAGALVGAGTQALAMAAPKVPGEMAERMRVQGEEFGEAFLKAAGSQYVEVLSERTGLMAERLIAPLKQAVATRWLRLNPAAGEAGFLRRIAKASGWNGVIGEVFEERVADVGRAAIGAEEFKFPSAEDLAAEIMAFSLPGAPGAAMQVLAPRQPKVANPEIMKVIGDTLAETQILQKLPEKAEEFVAVQTRGTDKEFTYIPVDSWVSLWQSQKDEKTGLPLDPRQMASDVLGNAEAFDQALEAGSDLKIPTARYAVTIGANEKFKDLFQEELRFDPEELNVREQKELKERVQKAEEAVKAQEAEKKSPAVDLIEESAERVGQQIQQALEVAGFRKEAPSYAALVKQTFKRFGQRLGKDPMELFGQYGLTVERQAEPKPTTAAAFEQPAFHGSPHQFDKFSLQKIGTGEGAQAFGWGLYFAGSKDVAKYYRDALTKHELLTVRLGGKIAAQGDAIDKVGLEAIRLLEIGAERAGQFKHNTLYHAKQMTQDAEVLKRLEEWRDAKVGYERPSGRLYQVEIPEETDYLDWDKPLSEWSGKAADIVRGIKPEDLGLKFEKVKAWYGWVDKSKQLIGSAYKDEKRARESGVLHESQSGRAIYGDIAKALGSEEAASKFLASLGVAGIRFKDQASRGKEGGTNNYVIFDENLVKITGYEQPAEGGGARGRLRIGNAQMFIDLFQKADRSTFLHETGHFYLEMLGDLASRPDAPKEIRDDYQTVLDWLGVKDRSEIKTEQHEKWARGFEAYLMEGKAPTKSLRRAFYRFREWLSSVYEAAKEYFAGVGLSDPVRKVMDRLLASKEEIEAAEQEAGIEPLIKDPKALGLSDEWADKYEEAIRDARRTAEDKLVAKLMEEVRREDEAWYKAERERIREAVAAEVNAMREYVAVEALSKEGAQLDRAIVDDVFGPVTRKALPKRIVSAKDAKGVHPDHAADLYGFTSGDELIKALSSLEDKDALIERLTNERMEAAYGKLLTPEQRREEALKLLHNEDRAKVLRMEMEALAKMRPGATRGLIRRIATRRKADASVKAEAAERIAGTPIRDLKPGQYAAAERRAAREALDAALAGRWEEAVEAKEREILNNALYTATVEAKEEMDSAVEFAAGFGRTSVREKLGKAGADYLEQVDGILERFNFKPASLHEIDKRKRLAEWVKEREAENVPIEIPDNILDEAFRKHYKDLTVAELRDIRDTLEHLKHLANLKNRLLKNKAHRDLDEAITKAVASIEDNAKGVRKQEIETRLPGQEAKDLISGFFADHRKYANFARQLDGWKDGGIMWELLIRPANEAGDREAAMNEEAAVKLMALVNEWQKSTALKKHAQHIPQIDRSLTREGMIAVALNWGTEDNRAKLLAGYEWTELQADAILSKLGEADWKFVQGLWDFIDTYWRETKALSERVTGLAPEKVEASPINTPFGTFRGGYYPLKYDNKQSSRADALTVEQAAKEAMRGAHVRATTRHGFRKERVRGVKLPVRLDLGVVFQHVAEVIHDQTHFEFLIDTNKILRDERLQDAIKRHYGKPTHDQLKKAVESIAAGAMPAQNAVERAFNWLRVGASVSKMGWNVMTALKQPLGLTQSMVRVGPKWILKGVQRVLGDATRMENAAKWVHERSEFMRLRAKTQEREINEVRNKVQQNPTLVPRPVAESYFWLITRGQMIADIPTWIGAYEKAMAEAPKANSAEGAKSQEERAAALADQAVIDAQGGGQVKDLADIQRRSPMFKLWTTFYSYANTTYNLTVESVSRTNFMDPKSIGLLAADLLMLYTIPAILSVAITEALRGGGGDDDESFASKVASENASGLLGTLLIAREIQGVANGFRGYEGPSGTSAIAEFSRAAKQVAQGEVDEAAVKAVGQAAGSLFHLPSAQVERTLRGAGSLLSGETSNPLAPLVGPPRK